ncbi:MAG TPA: amidohydrolase family protein [Spirochaetota bacterium]|nr:amidohydrolase family protein [Spirochaetota bacterium]
MAVYLANATFIDWKSLEFKKGVTIKVEEGPAGGISFVDKAPAGGSDTVLDCTGKYVTKSFVCGHHHVYSALARGMNTVKKAPTNFLEVLQYVWWSLDKCLDDASVEASALVTAAACAKNGVTFCIDHHASPFAIPGSLEILAKAFDKVGVGHLLCYEITDRDGMDKAQAGLDETARFLASGRQGLVGLHASFTVGDETLKKAVDLARQTKSGIHVHVAEGTIDQEDSQQKYGMRVIERYKKAGVLDFSKTILGHCLHLDANERAILKDSPVWLVQNAESNMNNNVGAFDWTGLGPNLMFGTDGMHSDMIRSAKAAFFKNQEKGGTSYDEFYRRFRNVSNYLSSNGFSGDGENNLVVLNYDPPTDFAQYNVVGHILFGLDSSNVESVVSRGRLIVKDRVLQTVDEKEINILAREQADRLWDRMRKA